MRRAPLLLLSLVMLLAVPVAAVAEKGPGKSGTSAKGSVQLTRAVGVTDTHVVLLAGVVPGAAGLGATFEYGPTADYGFTAVAAPAVLPRSGAIASATIDGLTPSTTYHFRVVVGTGLVALAGPDATFTTAAPAPVQDDTQAEEPGEDRTELAPVQGPGAPVLGESVVVGPRAGKVKVRSADGKRFSLTEGATIPAGSVIDATNGTVAMTSALDDDGAVQTAEFSGGRFMVRQTGDGVVDIYLKGRIGRCRAKAAIASKKRPGRRLWGRDRNGKFRTHGNDSVASVRGTRWLTEDTCAGTRTRVTEGSVAVRDLNRKRTVVVRSGHSYLARRSG